MNFEETELEAIYDALGLLHDQTDHARATKRWWILQLRAQVFEAMRQGQANEVHVCQCGHPQDDHDKYGDCKGEMTEGERHIPGQCHCAGFIEKDEA